MYTLPKISYEYDALEPYIDEQTMQIHHTKHHQAYIDKLNKALEGNNDLQSQDITELIKNLDNIPEDIKTAVRNNGGGYYNHSLFWKIMTPTKNSPSEKLTTIINAQFGSIDQFKDKFSEIAATHFGSGWAWLYADGDNLQISSTPNQDSPLMEGKKPILGLDIWEHAYYLKYQNKRPEYIDAWWQVVSWPAVEELLFSNE